MHFIEQAPACRKSWFLPSACSVGKIQCKETQHIRQSLQVGLIDAGPFIQGFENGYLIGDFSDLKFLW